jgi:uncharacterized DUF497 family protein
VGPKEGRSESDEAWRRFADAAVSLEDPHALTAPDPDAEDEERFVTMAMDPHGRVLVTVYTYTGENRRIISARKASSSERQRYEIP